MRAENLIPFLWVYTALGLEEKRVYNDLAWVVVIENMI